MSQPQLDVRWVLDRDSNLLRLKCCTAERRMEDERKEEIMESDRIRGCRKHPFA